MFSYLKTLVSVFHQCTNAKLGAWGSTYFNFVNWNVFPNLALLSEIYVGTIYLL